MSDSTSQFSVCILIPRWRGAGVAPESARLGVPVYVAHNVAQAAGDFEGSAQELLLTSDGGDGELLLESLRRLHAQGFSHAVVLDAPDEHFADCARALIDTATSNPACTIVAHRQGVQAALSTRLGLRAASGLQLQDPGAAARCYVLAEIVDRHFVMKRSAFEVEVLVKLAWSSAPTLELAGAHFPAAVRPRFSLRRLHMYVRQINARWLLPPAFIEMATRQSFHDLNRRERFRESLYELFLREPGTNARIAISAGLGFFLALTPIWGFQILLTIYLCHRWQLSKTVALLCANISLPPLIPLIMYGSLVLGRVLLGGDAGAPPTTLELEPQDFWPWIVGSFALSAIAGLIGGTSVWILVSLARRMRNPSKA